MTNGRDPLIVCPFCQGELTDESCSKCGTRFPRRGGYMIFLPKGRIYREIASAYSNYAKIHDEFYNSIEGLRPLREMEEKFLRRALQLARKELALDVGCGPGRYTRILAHHFKRVYAVDISRSMLNVLRIQHGEKNIVPIVASSDYLPFQSETFDLYLSFFGAINHSSKRTIDEAVRVLKKNGVLVASFASPLPPWRMLRVFPSRISTPGGQVPMIHYPASWFKQYLQMNGMNVLKLHGAYWILPLKFKKKPNRALRLLDDLLGEIYPLNRVGAYTLIIAKK